MRSIHGGFSLVELLAALVLLGLLLVPAMQATQAALHTERLNRTAVVNDFRLVALAETVLAEPFDRLRDAALGAATPTAYSDSSGTKDRRLVFISGYDADNADADGDDSTGADDGILKIRVEVEGRVGGLYSLRYDN